MCLLNPSIVGRQREITENYYGVSISKELPGILDAIDSRSFDHLLHGHFPRHEELYSQFHCEK